MSEPAPGPWRKPPRKPRPVWIWFVAASGITAALVAYLMSRYPEALYSEGAKIGIVHRLLWLAFLLGSLVLLWRPRPGAALKQAALWLAIGAFVFLAYSFRFEAVALKDRMMAELLPHQGMVEDGAITFSVRAGGHFVVEADVDGTLVRFMVDTGASTVVLTPADAERLGFDLSALSFDRVFQTANGTVMGAPVRLGRVAIGPIALENVRATVNGAAMDQSLLGMSFLSRLSGYEVSGDRLTLRP